MADNLHMQAAVHAWMVECFGVSVTVDVVERADRFIEEALELAQATGWTADRGHALVDYVFGRPAGQIGQEVGGVMVTLCALCNTHGVDTDAEAWREINRIMQPDTVLKIREKQAAKQTGSALPGPSAAKPSTEGYVAAFYEIAEMLGVGAKTYSPAEAFERDIKPRLARLSALEDALRVARRTIVEGGEGGVSCTVWVPRDISPAETLVDYIDAALSTGEAV